MSILTTENAEWLVLESIFGLDWAADDAIETGLQPAHFSDLVAAKLYEVVHRRRLAGQPVNISDFTPDEFADLNPAQVARLEQKLQEARFETRTGVSAAHYAGKVIAAGLTRLHNESIRRSLQDVANGMDWQEAEARHQKRINRLTESTADDFRTFRDSVDDLLNEVDNPKSAANGIASGFYDLDDVIGGLRPGCLIIPTAATGGGKTALSVCIANNVAKAGGVVGFVSCEMKLRELHQRVACIESSVDSMAVKQGRLDDDDKRRYIAAVNAAAKLPFLVVDDNRNLDALVPRLRSRHRRKPFALIVADYTQLLQASGSKNANREQRVSEVGNVLKNLAMELGVPVIAPAQHNKEAERRDGKPSPTDLRESAGLGHTADVVLYVNAGSDNKANLYVAKNRGGPEGVTVLLTWQPQYTRFENHYFHTPDFGSDSQ